ncbi:MAG: HD-GYP domain-containing protein [Planctomycetota bacterium]
MADPALSPLTDRLTSMGLPACVAPDPDGWVCDAPGRAELLQLPGIDQAWREGLSNSGDAGQVVALGHGLHAVWLRPQGPAGPAWLVPAVTRVWLHSQEFEQLSIEAGCPAAELREALAPLTEHGCVDAEALARMLGWACQDLREQGRSTEAITQLSDKLLTAYEESTLVYRFTRLINWDNDPAQTVQIACGQLAEVLPFRWVTIGFYAQGTLPALAGQRFEAGDTSRLSDGALDGVIQRLFEKPNDQWARVAAPEALGLAEQVNSELLIERICHEGKPLGVIVVGDTTDGDPEVSSQYVQLIDAISDFLGMYHANAARHADQLKLFRGTVRALTSSIDAKDPYTRGHSERVALVACQLAEAIGLGDDRVEEVRLSGLLHDVGKIGVPEAVLCSARKLNDDEFSAIKQHPLIGHAILQGIPQLEPMLGAVRSHHERWDGRGYPDGLAGEDIPLYGRIVAYADTFDAMRSNRSYRQAMPHDKVMAEIAACAGTQLDPGLATAFSGLDFAEFEQRLAEHASGAPWAKLSA